MNEREPVLEKRAIRLPDGRRLVFYDFREAPPRERPDPPTAAAERRDAEDP